MNLLVSSVHMKFYIHTCISPGGTEQVGAGFVVCPLGKIPKFQPAPTAYFAGNGGRSFIVAPLSGPLPRTFPAITLPTVLYPLGGKWHSVNWFSGGC